MKNVSSKFMAAVYAPTRQTRVSIAFPFVDSDAKEAARLEEYPEASQAGHPGQIIDSSYDMLGKIAQFEPDYWRLDGSFVLPLEAGQTRSQYGYWSEALSDAAAAYPAGTRLRLYFGQPVTVPGLTLFFDTATGNCLEDFDCIAYDQNMNELRREEIRGNREAHFVLDRGVVALKYMDIVCHKSSLPHRRIRLVEIDFGIMLNFEGHNLLSASLVSECDHMSESIPDNELNFVAINDGKFDYSNPESYSKYLQRRQQFIYRHSVVLPDGAAESAEMGAYALQSWQVNDTQLRIKARLDLSALEEHHFRRYSLSERLSCGQLIERIFADCGWQDYEIAEYLYQSPPILPYTGEVSNKEALRMAAQLGGAVVIKLPGGKIAVDRVDFAAREAVDAINYDNSLAATKAASSQYYNAINLTVTMLSQKDTPQANPIARYSGRPTQPGVAEEFIIPFDYILYDETPEVHIEGGSLIEQTLYANYAFITVLAQGEFALSIRGQTADFNQSAEIVYLAPWYQEGEEVKTYKLALPMMIQTEGFGELRDWCAAQRFRVLEQRLRTESEWRQNPALDIGDYLDVQTDKSGGSTKVFAEKHVLEYSGGALRGNTAAIGQGQMLVN